MATSMTIPEFYADKNVFITGATGFIGKVLIEKLFRCCPNVKGIYCLIRPKRGKTAEERLKDMEVNKVGTWTSYMQHCHFIRFYRIITGMC